MKKLLAALAIVLFCTSIACATTLRWDAVPDTEEYTIAGYVVYFWAAITPDKRYAYVAEGVSVPSIETTLNLLPGRTYNFTVAPYTIFNELGEESQPIEFVCGERPPPENSLPTHIYIPGPINIIIGAQ